VGELRPAREGYPIKLVRDETETIINGTGKPGALFYDELPFAERGPWLRRKLVEEVGEYLEDRGADELADELADVLAVVEGLAVLHGFTLTELTHRLRQDPRGGFITGRMMRGYHPEFDGTAPSSPASAETPEQEGED
jgi:predicted house-cleaning noncanonical NTP pyrophosphatase (MazG superfamily)